MDDLFKHIYEQEEDQLLADEAMRNTYDFVIGGYNWEKLPEAFWMLGDPESNEAIKDLIAYFEEMEEYEKCSKLVKVLKKNK